MKYVMMETTEGQKLPFVFPECVNHSVMTAVAKVAIEEQLKTSAIPVSAGFVSLGLGAEVHGKSESLGDLPSVPSDAARIVVGHSIAFMPDVLADQMLERLRDTERLAGIEEHKHPLD